jgi:hypothetical protein
MGPATRLRACEKRPYRQIGLCAGGAASAQGAHFYPGVIQRINRKLAAKGQIPGHARWKQDYGDYCTPDLSGNVMDADINPEELP